MKLQHRNVEDPDVNLTPLIDVVLLLLVFFMVSTTFIREAELMLELPEASANPVDLESSAVEVIVQEDGRYFVAGRELVNNSAETLERALLRIAGEARDQPVTIRADGRATHQSVVTVMDVAGKLGFTEVNIVTVQQDDAN